MHGCEYICKGEKVSIDSWVMERRVVSTSKLQHIANADLRSLFSMTTSKYWTPKRRAGRVPRMNDCRWMKRSVDWYQSNLKQELGKPPMEWKHVYMKLHERGKLEMDENGNSASCIVEELLITIQLLQVSVLNDDRYFYEKNEDVGGIRLVEGSRSVIFSIGWSWASERVSSKSWGGSTFCSMTSTISLCPWWRSQISVLHKSSFLSIDYDLRGTVLSSFWFKDPRRRKIAVESILATPSEKPTPLSLVFKGLRNLIDLVYNSMCFGPLVWAVFVPNHNLVVEMASTGIDNVRKEKKLAPIATSHKCK